MAYEKIRPFQQSFVLKLFARSIVFASALSVVACGSGDDSETEPKTTPSGLEAWNGYCKATFTKDYVVQLFDREAFTAHAGDEFLVADWSHDWFEEKVMELHYLAPQGAWDFEVKVPADQDFPVTLSCDSSSAWNHAVFADIDVYDFANGSTKLCHLQAGSVLPAGDSPTFGVTSAVAREDGKFEVSLGAFSSQCGASKGLIDLPFTPLFDAEIRLMPLQVIFSAAK